MKDFHKLEKKCPEGIPFSKCREYMKKKAQTKKRKNTKKKKKRKGTIRKKQFIPPKGVVIRKKDKLYRSNGKKLQLI